MLKFGTIKSPSTSPISFELYESILSLEHLFSSLPSSVAQVTQRRGHNIERWTYPPLRKHSFYNRLWPPKLWIDLVRFPLLLVNDWCQFKQSGLISNTTYYVPSKSINETLFHYLHFHPVKSFIPMKKISHASVFLPSQIAFKSFPPISLGILLHHIDAVKLQFFFLSKTIIIYA